MDILKNKHYLYLTEFFSGMSVMAVELGASRLLAPYFSSSQIVWTIIIGTIMIAMALGNVYGGRSADKNPDPDRLYRRILVAAVWIAAIPFAGRYVILGVSALLVFTVSTHFLVIAAFCSCMVIFVFPLFLLGTVTPSLVKYTVDSLDDNGRTVGTLGAFNTVGSIIGTFLPTFVTIPTVGTSVTFLIFSGILLLLSLAYFVSKRRGARACAASVALFVAFSVAGHDASFAFWEDDLAYEGESIYNYLQVRETDESVILSTNVLFGVQSIMKKDEGLTGMYYDYALAAPYLAGAADREGARVLILGMGTGTYARQCLKYFDNAHVEGVEIDQKITDLAGEYFGLPGDVPVATYDGRAYLQAVDEKYDVIMVDAYQDITIPFQMSSAEFFSLVKEHLSDGGVMVVNMNMKSDGEGAIDSASPSPGINTYLADTIAAQFETVCTVDVPGATNRILFAMEGDAPLDALRGEAGAESAASASREGAGAESAAREVLGAGSVASFLRGEADAEEDADLSALLSRVADGIVPYRAGGHILTDDKAPVELLGMRVIDGLIQDEIGYYRGVIERYGIEGILGGV